METTGRFAGFGPGVMRFFSQLKRNNNRAWFEKHKAEYLEQVLNPARAFVQDMGPALGRVFPGIVADPTGGGSIFRIHKDARFSADKSPYKTHLGIFFWQGPGRKMERPGFYFELDDTGLTLYYGMYVFPPAMLKAYREAVADPRRGDALVKAKRRVERGGIEVGGEHYKRVPRGFDLDGERAALIRYNTLYTAIDCGKPPEIFSSRLIGYCVRQWKRSAPVVQWVRTAGVVEF